MANDRELWERVRRGDTHAFNEFYRQHASRLEVFLRHLVGNRQVAEDLMQETFMQIWRRPNGFHAERGTLSAYLLGIGRKRAAEWWRTNGATDHRSADETSPDEIAATIAVTNHTESASIIADALGQLPVEQRTLLWLRAVERQSYAELAETLDVPVRTVRSRLFSAREALRKIWKSPSGDTPRKAHETQGNQPQREGVTK